MTAEIIIMNKMAIAMAADSAVTIGQKIYNSANKLFTLSKYHPVGIMIYGNATFMDIPWETIIKVYRQKLSDTKFDTLAQYTEDFITFLSDNDSLFTEAEQKKCLFGTVEGYFLNQIIRDIRKEVDNTIDNRNKIKISEIKRIVASCITRHLTLWRKIDPLPSMPPNHGKTVIRKYDSEIGDIIKKTFENLPLTKKLVKALKEISGYLFTKDLFPQKIPGLVIAGFGDAEIFPSYKSFLIECRVGNRLKYREDKKGAITFDSDAFISPFAQSEMVEAFMEGIDPAMETTIMAYLKEVFEKYPDLIIRNLVTGSDDEKKKVSEALKKTSKELFESFKKEVTSYSRVHNVNPVLNAVGVLPKDELAAMAEALVNLTSFKRRITMDAETVGGPIDVAVISKGDGFIWIKRKHYFKSELNQHFMINYFRGGSGDRK